MALSVDSQLEQVGISKVAGRYLVFDIDAVTHLRKNFNICGVLIGGIPQIPQQNLFLGLPLELLPEEVKTLVDRGAAYIIDDKFWHKNKFSKLSGKERRRYIEPFKSAGIRAQETAVQDSAKRAERGLARQFESRKTQNLAHTKEEKPGTTDNSQQVAFTLFEDVEPASSAPRLSPLATNPSTYTITPTTSWGSNSITLDNPKVHSTKNDSSRDTAYLNTDGSNDIVAVASHDIAVPSSYPLFLHLHSKNYFMTPGLRFGCQYTVYPGDPLRFHSHFLAVGYGWNEDVPLMDLVGGGRLGTGVKKGFLVGAKDTTPSDGDGDGVRTFCIEWGGM